MRCISRMLTSVIHYIIVLCLNLSAVIYSIAISIPLFSFVYISIYVCHVLDSFSVIMSSDNDDDYYVFNFYEKLLSIIS